MSFEKVTYVDGETVIYAQNLNDIQDEIINQSNALSAITTDLPFDTVIPINAFTYETSRDTFTLDDNGGITISTTSSGTYQCVSTQEGCATEYFTPGKKYLVHFSATPISGTPYISCNVRGTASSPNDTVASGGSKSTTGGTFEFEFEMTQYVTKISLFITYSSSKSASVRYYDFWVKEIVDSAVDLKARQDIQTDIFREKNISNGFSSFQINDLCFERGGINASTNPGKNYDGDTTYQSKGMRTCGWFSIGSYSGDVYFITNNESKAECRVFQKHSDTTVEFVGMIDCDHPICLGNSAGDTYRIAFHWDDAADAYKAGEWKSLIDICYYPTRTMNLASNCQPKKQYCVMTHNVGEWYNGSGTFSADIQNDSLELEMQILKRYCPDILACQEYKNFKTLLSPFYDDQFSYYPNTNNYVGKFVGTNYELDDSEGNTYTNQDSGSSLLWNYTKSYIWLNGRKVCLISTHLSTTTATGVLQVQELFAIAEEEEYVIICGDFNADCSAVTDQNYIDYYKPFVDAGYNLANCGEWGFMPTWYTTAVATPKLLDNIITSGNIKIDYACVDKLKLTNPLDPTKADHMPLIAYIEFADQS